MKVARVEEGRVMELARLIRRPANIGSAVVWEPVPEDLPVQVGWRFADGAFEPVPDPEEDE